MLVREMALSTSARPTTPPASSDTCTVCGYASTVSRDGTRRRYTTMCLMSRMRSSASWFKVSVEKASSTFSGAGGSLARLRRRDMVYFFASWAAGRAEPRAEFRPRVRFFFTCWRAFCFEAVRGAF